MDDRVSTGVQRARELRILGRYADAVSYLEELLQSSQCSPNLVVELSETFFVQGFFVRAISALDTHLTNNDPEDHILPIVVQLIRSFADFFVSTEFKEPLQQADIAYASFHSSPQSQVVNDATVRIETYYCKFRHLSACCGAFDDGYIREKLLLRLEKIFHILIERSDFWNALLVARTYNTCNNCPDKSSLAQNLATCSQTPGLYRAHAQFLLAKNLSSKEQREEQDRLYVSARQLFRDAGHVHGVLDTDIAMMCRLPLDSNEDDFDEKLHALFKRYEDLDHPTGLADGLMQLLDIAHKLSDFQTESLVLNSLESLFEASTSKLTWLMVRVSTLARLSVRGGDRGKIIQGGETLYNELVRSDCAFLRGQAAQLVSQAYLALKDRDMMRIWSQRAQEDLEDTNLTAIPSLITGYDLSSVEGLTQCYQMITSTVDTERADYSPETAAEKFEVFADQALQHKHRDPAAWDIIDTALKQFEEHISRSRDAEFASLRLAKLRESQASTLMSRASARRDIDLELAAVAPLKEARDLYLKTQRLGSAVLVLQREALLNLGIAQKFERMHDNQVQFAWQTALRQYKVAFDSANGLGLTFLESENAYWVAFCEYRQWGHGWCSANVVLQSLLKAERFIDRQRQEVSILRGMAATIAKRRLSSDGHARTLYQIAIQICLSSENLLDAWNWTQKSKARSLSDLLGLGVLIPQQMMERIQSNSNSRKLFEEESALARSLAAASETERFEMRIKLESHQKTMREEPVLAELLDLREGVPVSLNELFASRLEVDQIHDHATVREERPVLIELPITLETVQRWVLEHLNNAANFTGDTASEASFSGLMEEDEADEGPLRHLDALIAPLYSPSQPDDLLVLCPTGVLHALLLHALRFGPQEENKILIQRNPVVYCASLTSFVQCWHRAEASIVTDSKKHFLAVYEQDSGRAQVHQTQFDDTERHQIYASTERLAKELNGEYLCGVGVTAANFKNSLECADWVHFFGHYDYSFKLVAEQSLLVGGEGREDNARVAVKDLFSFRIKSSHITLLACASAVQDFQAGDEPLGLITAFLSAGATSVLGTLWPVQSSAARLFSKHFYSHLLQSAANKSGQRLYNLAHAVREAVLDVRQDWEFRQPYHWASIVLHGASFYHEALRL